MYTNEQMQLFQIEKDRFNENIINKVKIINKYYENYNKRYDKFTNNYKNTMENAFNSLNIKHLISKKYGGLLYENATVIEDQTKIVECLDLYLGKLENLKYLDFLSEEKRNVVFVGPNGCGKTTLIRHLRELTGEDQISYFQADRLLLIDSSYSPERDDVEFNRSLKNVSINSANLSAYHIEKQLNLTVAQFEKERAEELEMINSAELSKDESKTNYILKIWNELIKDRILFCKGTLKVKTLDGIEYPIKNLSSGERSILYFLSSIILSEQKQYYFIDEPENNLNPAIVSKLWNILEKFYPNSIFVYLTHDSDFVASRINSKIYWIQKYDGKAWVYKPLPENNNLPQELVISLVGNRQPVLFCESENEDKYDTIVYKIMFPEFKVVSAGGCEKVLTKTKAYYELGLSQKAFGIIDRDYKSEEYLNGEEKNNVYHLPFFEIENFLISSEILEQVVEKFCDSPNEVINRVKYKIKQDFCSKKNLWIIRNIGSQLHKTNFDRKINNLESTEELIKVYEGYMNEINVKEMIADYSNLFDKIVEQNDYDTILKYYDNKNNLFKIIEKEINIENFNYGNEVLTYLNNEGKALLYKLRNDYFPEIKGEN